MAKETFIAGNEPLVFPPGTIVAHLNANWGMYTNSVLNVTWIGYKAPGGTRIMRLPGIRTKFSRDFGDLSKFVVQRQATACGACGD